MVSEEGYQIALLTFRMNNPVMMTTEPFNQNVSKLFSKHKLVTDNLPLSVTQEPTEKPLKNNNAIVITTVFIYHSFRSRQTRVSWVQYSSTQFIGFHMKSHNPYKAHGIHSKIFAVIGCSTSIVAIATFSNLISVPVISVPYKKKNLSAVLLYAEYLQVSLVPRPRPDFISREWSGEEATYK